MKKALLFLATMVILTAVGVQLYSSIKYPNLSTLEKPLSELLPAELEGWTVQDQPISDSPDQVARAEEILRYDDILYRTYFNKNIRLGLYVAYWKPAKMPYAMIGTHNPDTCWINVGWKREKREYAVPTNILDKPLKPCEFGAYSKNGDILEVVFWHVVGDKTLNYAQDIPGYRNGLQGRLERLPFFIRDFKEHGLDQHREQFFVRISSNTSFNDLWDNEDFARLIDSLAIFGIFPENVNPPQS